MLKEEKNISLKEEKNISFKRGENISLKREEIKNNLSKEEKIKIIF